MYIKPMHGKLQAGVAAEITAASISVRRSSKGLGFYGVVNVRGVFVYSTHHPSDVDILI